MNTEDLLKLKRKIEKSKERLAELKGSQTSLLARLKKEHNCSTIDEAEIKLQSLQEEINKKAARIAKNVERLREKYPALFTE